jgi:hypothetical protein
MAPRGVETQTAAPDVRYRIRVKGILEERWSGHFGGITLTTEGRDTVLSGRIPDQAALHGLLAQIRDLGLPLLSVETVAPDAGGRDA